MVKIFESPPNISIEQLITALDQKAQPHIVSKVYSLKTYYDSFDWRLYRSDLICEFNRSKYGSVLTLTGLSNNETVASTTLNEVPAFAEQFNPGKIRKLLRSILQMRALSAICTLECESYQINLLDACEQLVLCLQIEIFDLLNTRVTLLPLKGHEKFARQFAEFLSNDLGLTAVSQPVLLSALKLHGRQAKDYSSKLHIKLSPELDTESASKVIFKELARIIKANEQGVIADTDSEYLHDFRVAVRKTRTALKLFQPILPESIYAAYQRYFSSLSQLTSETRDLDIFLLNFEQYRKGLPERLQSSLDPLMDELLTKKNTHHLQVANNLKSSDYRKTMADWESFLNTGAASALSANPAIKDLADRQIWRLYQKTLKQAQSINRSSPASDFHQLRITSKKLRYLMEFLQTLYPERKIKKAMNAAKNLQDALGAYQDASAQQMRLEHYGEALSPGIATAKTLIAIGALIQTFEARKIAARDHYSAQFSKFVAEEVESLFENLFKPEIESSNSLQS
jgi:CHAD domain-containing protein